MVVERCRGRTLGVTGSAGKTTATRLTTAMMQASGICVVNADDPGAAMFAAEARGRVVGPTGTPPPATGAGPRRWRRGHRRLRGDHAP